MRALSRNPWSLAVAAAGLALGAAWAMASDASAPRWAMNATAIEACSCPMFCQCYFNSEPAGHHERGGETHYCRANLAYKVNKGHYGATDLAGAKFWVVNDLGADFADGKMDWAVVYFDRAVTAEQRTGIKAALGHLFPVQWGSFETAEAAIDRWEIGDGWAHATIDGGKTAEVKLVRPAAAANGPGQVVIKNLKYWGAPRNDGFILMPNEVQAYRVSDKAFETRGTNGFLITVDLSSADMAASGM